jgi:hypothetical protein
MHLQSLAPTNPHCVIHKEGIRIVSDWGCRNRLTFAPNETYQLLLAKKNSFALTRISNGSWGSSFNNLKIIYNAAYLGCINGSPVWAYRATIGAARRILLRSQRLALIFLCNAYRTVSTEALSVLACVIPVDLEIQRRALMYFVLKNLTPQFLQPRDQDKIARLFNYPSYVREELLSEWQSMETSIKGRHLFRFFPSVREKNHG